MSNRQQTSTRAQVWFSLRSRIIRELSWTPDRIWLTDRKEEPQYLATGPHLQVFFETEVPHPGAAPRLPGGGRLARQVFGNITITIWTRSTRDQPGKAESLLVDAQEGLYNLNDQLFDALDQRMLFLNDDITRKALLSWPLHWERDDESMERSRDDSHMGLSSHFSYARMRDIKISNDPTL